MVKSLPNAAENFNAANRSLGARGKGRGCALVMAPEGPEIIAHGFSRGKADGTRGALEGRYKRLLPLANRRRISRRSYVGGQKSLRKAVSPPSGLLVVIALHPRLEAVGYDLPAPFGAQPSGTAPPGRCFGPRSQLSEAERRRCGLSRCRNSRDRQECLSLLVPTGSTGSAPTRPVRRRCVRGPGRHAGQLLRRTCARNATAN